MRTRVYQLSKRSPILTHQQQNIRKNVHKTIKSSPSQPLPDDKTTILGTFLKANLGFKIRSLYLEPQAPNMLQKKPNKNNVFKAKQLGPRIKIQVFGNQLYA